MRKIKKRFLLSVTTVTRGRQKRLTMCDCFKMRGRLLSLTQETHVRMCGRTSALSIARMKDGIQQILFTDETYFCHILLPVFRGNRGSWRSMNMQHTQNTQSVLNCSKGSTWYIFLQATVTVWQPVMLSITKLHKTIQLGPVIISYLNWLIDKLHWIFFS